MEFFFPGWEAAVSPTLGELALGDTAEGRVAVGKER